MCSSDLNRRKGSSGNTGSYVMSKLHASPSLALEEKLVCISGQEVDKYVRTATIALENMSSLPAELFMDRQRDRKHKGDKEH